MSSLGVHCDEEIIANEAREIADLHGIPRPTLTINGGTSRLHFRSFGNVRDNLARLRVRFITQIDACATGIRDFKPLDWKAWLTRSCRDAGIGSRCSGTPRTGWQSRLCDTGDAARSDYSSPTRANRTRTPGGG